MSVAARFDVPEADGRAAVDALVASWIADRTASGVDLLADLVAAPYAETPSESTAVDVVFDGRPDSRLWRDWLVFLTSEINKSRVGTMLGFYDRVAGTFRPTNVTDLPGS